MHPVLIYGILFITITVGLLFVFEAYPIGSIYLLLIISAVATAIFGRLLVKLFPADDPLQQEIEKEKLKLRSNEYQREIQFLFNIVQPDPRLQPNPRRIGESLLTCFNIDEEIMRTRLQQYFGDSFNVSLNQPLPDLVEKIKAKYKDWLNP